MKLTNKNLEALKGNNSLKDYCLDYLLDIPGEERDTLIQDLLSYGCISGMVSGLIYYPETIKFADEYQDEIWDLASEQMASLGETNNILQFFASLNGSKDVGSMEQFKNLLAWYGFEEMTRIIYEQDLQNEL